MWAIIQRYIQKIRRYIVVFLTTARSKLRRLATPKHIIFAVCTLLASILLLYLTSFFWPKNITFSYSGNTCFSNPVIFPQSIKISESQTFTAEFSGTWQIANIDIYSPTTCVNISDTPSPNTKETLKQSPFTNSSLIPAKHIHIQTSELPTATARLQPDKPISNKDPLQFELTTADIIFDYALTANNVTTTCSKNDTELVCELPPHKLKQATEYKFTLEQTFKDKTVAKIFTQKLTTVEPMQVLGASLNPGQTVYTKPKQIQVAFNKPISAADNIKLEHVHDNGERQALEHTASYADTILILDFSEDLPRQAHIELSVQQAYSADNAYLPTPYLLPFVTSGGPIVQHISLPTSRVTPGSAFSIAFDSTLLPNQNLAHFIRVETTEHIAATVTAQGTRVIVTPAALPPCTPFTVKVLDGLQNEWGVSGGSAWQFASRTICHTAFTIGGSVQGRGITAYRFGSGPSRMVFVGGIHGHEKSSVYILQSLINDLESHPHILPAHRTLTIIPLANPDGYAANTRVNANNVDLNRNFPANDWKQDVTIPGGHYPTGGGSAPLSEPESRAVANFIASQNARLVMSFHAVAPLVAANEAGDSLNLAHIYGQKARIPSYGSAASAVFHYDTTGALENWLRDKLDTPGLLVELSSFSGNEYLRHKDAMHTMIQLP